MVRTGPERPDSQQPEAKPMLSFVQELWSFLRVRKKMWMLPIIVLALVFGALVILTKGSAVAPFIYTIF
jgi:hypothetical protein